jgi:hypothetical protein
MWKKSPLHLDHERLDRFGEELLNVIEASEAEIDRAAASPFLYRRILARIEAERKRRAEEWNRWMAVLREAQNATPIFALIAIVVAAFVWQASEQLTQAPAVNNRSSLPLTVSSELLPVSNDEMVTSVVGWDERGLQGQQ